MKDGIVAAVIGAIGEPGFVGLVATELRRSIGFDRSAMLLHRRTGPELLFDDFGAGGDRRGLENYVRHTHSINPMLRRRAKGCVRRARDYRLRREEARRLAGHVILCADEEMGFRTVGWPAGLEEVGLYIETRQGLLELGCYRQRGSRPVSGRMLAKLSELGAPIGAAFDRDRALGRKSLRDRESSRLTPRQDEVLDLLLLGCSSTAIAGRLGISLHTVKDHRKQIFGRLGIGSLAELFALARRDHLPLRRDG